MSIDLKSALKNMQTAFLRTQEIKKESALKIAKMITKAKEESEELEEKGE